MLEQNLQRRIEAINASDAKVTLIVPTTAMVAREAYLAGLAGQCHVTAGIACTGAASCALPMSGLRRAAVLDLAICLLSRPA